MRTQKAIPSAAQNTRKPYRKPNDFETWGVKEHVFRRVLTGPDFLNLETGEIRREANRAEVNPTRQRITLKAETEQSPA
jgi:hypothetical protein